MQRNSSHCTTLSRFANKKAVPIKFISSRQMTASGDRLQTKGQRQSRAQRIEAPLTCHGPTRTEYQSTRQDVDSCGEHLRMRMHEECKSTSGTCVLIPSAALRFQASKSVFALGRCGKLQCCFELACRVTMQFLHVFVRSQQVTLHDTAVPSLDACDRGRVFHRHAMSPSGAEVKTTTN